MDHLVNEVILDPRFSPPDLLGFSSAKETAKFDEHITFGEDRWQKCKISIEVPDGKPHIPPEKPSIFTLSDFRQRSITEVIKMVWSNTSTRSFHFFPFRQLWCHIPSQMERLHSKIYTSDTFIQAHEEVQQLPREADCQLERVICALMFWSDSTYLASFRNASLWPLYMFFWKSEQVH